MDVLKPSRIHIPGKIQNEINVAPTPTPNKEAGQESGSETPSISISEMTDSRNDKITNERPETKLARSMSSLKSIPINAKPMVVRTQSCPQLKPYDDCREFENFSGEWVDSKGQTVKISPWGVIRYPSNPKLRFEAVHLGPNHLQVTFDKDPKRRKFVGKLNHECTILIWSNDTKWIKKGCKNDPRFLTKSKEDDRRRKNNGSCLVM